MKSRLILCLAATLMLGGCIASLGDLQGDLLSGRPSDAQFAEMDYTTPGEIEATYAENPLDADRKYTGKWTKVRGVIEAAPTEALDLSHKRTGFSLALGDEKKTRKTKFSLQHCTFPPDKATEDVMRGLKLGQVVEVGGRLTEYKQGFRAPFLRDCLILKVVR